MIVVIILKILFYYLNLFIHNIMRCNVKRTVYFIEIIILCYLDLTDNNRKIFKSFLVFFIILNSIQIITFLYECIYDYYMEKDELQEEGDENELEELEELEDEDEENVEDEKIYLDLNLNLPNHYYELKNSNDTTIDDINNEINILYENCENINSNDYLNQCNYLRRIYFKIKNNK